MQTRTQIGVALLIAGSLCVAVTLVVTAWLDTVSLHERSAEIQAAVQAELQGKALKELIPHRSVLSPIMVWLTFGIGANMLIAGLTIGIRSASKSNLLPSS